jgi:major inositol transporter-like SP family MFS transporter
VGYDGGILPNESKGWARGLAVSVNWILVFSVTNLYGTMIDSLGAMITFGIFGGMYTLATVIIAFIVPETTGKTREEIQLELRGT